MSSECVVDDEGTKRWFRDGKLHREDGPAVEYANGDKYWYRDGNYLSENEFKTIMKTKSDIKPGTKLDVDGYVRTPVSEDIVIGTVLRRSDNEAQDSYSDCTVIHVSEKNSHGDVSVRVVRPYVYADTVGLVANFLTGVEQYSLTMTSVLRSYVVILKSDGSVTKMNANV